MNITDLSTVTAWELRPSGNDCVLAIAPAGLGEDGQLAAFYVAQPTSSTFVITDLGETAMHASATGVDLNKGRVNALNSTNGVKHARVLNDGSIYAEGDIADVQLALWDALKLAMSFSFNLPKWSPKLDQMRFRALVERILLKTIGENALQRSVKATGISGHTVEFSFGIVDAKSIMHYVEPIALSNGKVDWQHVYQAHGKLSDVKQADSNSERLVIFEDGAPELEYGRATTLLSQAASIQTLAQARQGLSILLRDPLGAVGARTAGHKSLTALLGDAPPKVLE